MNEHFKARNHFGAPGFCHFQQAGYNGVVHHIENKFCFDFFFLQRGFPRIPQSEGSSVDDHIKFQLLKVGALNAASVCLTGKFLGRPYAAVQDVNFRPPLLESKYRSSCCTAGA